MLLLPPPAQDYSVYQAQAISAPAQARLLLAQADTLSSAPAPKVQAMLTPPGGGKKKTLASMPERIKLRYQLSWNGLPANGEMQWQKNGSRYHVELKLSAVIGPTLRYVSDGRIGKQGLIPERYQAWRNDQQREKAEFAWPGMTLNYGDGETKQATLEPHAQDFLSVDWQLALAPGTLLEAPVQVTNGKKVYHYALIKVGTDRSRGLAVNVYRTQKEGDTTEFSMANGYYHLPVRILYKDDQKTLEMTATQIEVNGKTVWSAPQN